MKKLFFRALSSLLLCVFLVGCSSGWAAGKVSVASKTFTENMLLGEIYALLIENRTDIEVVRMQGIGGTPICYSELMKGEVDIYIEYTGTLYIEMLQLEYDPNIEQDEFYSIVKKEMNDTQGVTVFSPIGFNNTFALAMQREKAEALGIETISDLTGHAPGFVFAANSLYYARLNDGYDALVDRYGVNFKSAVKMDTADLYDAANLGQVDVIVVYATDSLLRKYNMTILDDDKQMFPDYRSIPIIRSQTLKRYPELSGVLELLAGRIDDERMQQLNYMVDIENRPIDEVARSFLTEEGFLQ